MLATQAENCFKESMKRDLDWTKFSPDNMLHDSYPPPYQGIGVLMWSSLPVTTSS
jgi:hypothetical protein